MSKINYEAVLINLDKKTEELKHDVRSTPSYWNGDDRGSISGHRDAIAWVRSERVAYLKELLGVKD